MSSELNESPEAENSDADICEEPAEQSDLSKDLAHYVTVAHPPTKKVNLLLNILHKNGIRDIPKSYEKLMSTPKEKIIQKEVAGGRVFHYGIVKALQFRESVFRDVDEILLDIGVDGARIFSCSVW